MALGWGCALGQNDLFQRGNSAYTAAEQAEGEERAQYLAEAETAYREALEEGSSWVLHYNLGNVLYQQERYGEAVLQYRRALAIAPGQSVAQSNLMNARSAAGLPQPPENRLVDLASHLPLSAWATIVTTAGWIAVFTGLIPIFYKGHSALSVGSTLAMLLVAAAGMVGMYGWHLDAGQEVVLVEAAQLRAAPSTDATARRNLPEALYVRPKRNYEDWVYVVSEQGDEGWVQRDQIGNVWRKNIAKNLE